MKKLISNGVTFAAVDIIQKAKLKLKNLIRMSYIHSFLISYMLLSGLILSTDMYADGTLYYSVTDNTVRGINMVTGDEEKLLIGFNGAAVGAARNTAFDPDTNLIWYSSTDGVIYSFNVDTLVDGPTIIGVPGANPGAGRHLFIDYANQKMLIPITDGSVAIYSLATQTFEGTISSAFFLGANVGFYRHMASDVRRGTVWYADTAGRFVEMYATTSTHTGRIIPFNEQVGADPGAYRHFIVDPHRDLLIYSVTDGSLASIDLKTLKKGLFTVSSAYFVGANPGAGRVLTYDFPPDYPPYVNPAIMPAIYLLLLN